MSDRRDAARKKLLNLLGRNDLEEVSGLEAPWHADRATLISRALTRWDSDAIETAVKRIMSNAGIGS